MYLDHFDLCVCVCSGEVEMCANRALAYLPYLFIGVSAFIYCCLSVSYFKSISHSQLRLSSDLRKIRRAIAEERRNETSALKESGSGAVGEPGGSSGGNSKEEEEEEEEEISPNQTLYNRTKRSPPHSAHDMRYFRI